MADKYADILKRSNINPADLKRIANDLGSPSKFAKWWKGITGDKMATDVATEFYNRVAKGKTFSTSKVLDIEGHRKAAENLVRGQRADAAQTKASSNVLQNFQNAVQSPSQQLTQLFGGQGGLGGSMQQLQNVIQYGEQALNPGFNPAGQQYNIQPVGAPPIPISLGFGDGAQELGLPSGLPGSMSGSPAGSAALAPDQASIMPASGTGAQPIARLSDALGGSAAASQQPGSGVLPSKYFNYLDEANRLGYQGLKEGATTDLAKAFSEAQGRLAMQGGMRAGAGERLASQSALSQNRTLQDLSRQQQQSRMQLLGGDLQSQQAFQRSLMQLLPSLQLQQAGLFGNAYGQEYSQLANLFGQQQALPYINQLGSIS